MIEHERRTLAPNAACPIEMSDGKACGLSSYAAGHGADPRPVCLMHSRDAHKDSGEFAREVRAIIDGSPAQHSNGALDFTGFVFPEASLAGAVFAQHANFTRATFVGDAHFTGATFAQGAAFHHASFSGQADFNKVTFGAAALFAGATFKYGADFHHGVFSGESDFAAAHFTRAASFSAAQFLSSANFRAATFSAEAHFSGAEFHRDADFAWATFAASVDFVHTVFAGGVDFNSTQFAGIANFRDTDFRDPALVLFRRVNEHADHGMSARFFGCRGLEYIHFQDVHWSRPSGRLLLRDEVDLADEKWADQKETQEVVADVYRRLLNNFEKNRQYTLAEECFYGEMERRRLNLYHFPLGHAKGVREFYSRHKWAHRLGESLSATNFYRLLSNYGSSYTRALGALAVLLLIFALLLPVFGLRMSARSGLQFECPGAVAGSPRASTISWSCALGSPQPARQLWRIFGAGVLASLETASFQKDHMVESATPGTRVVEIFETVVVAAQAALILLAVSRRFRR
jgi:uncharacterized protein YjbI with pentapeptide repeats